jgi:hypothetical protein
MQHTDSPVEDRDGVEGPSNCAPRDEFSDEFKARVARLLEYGFPH